MYWRPLSVINSDATNIEWLCWHVFLKFLYAIGRQGQCSAFPLYSQHISWHNLLYVLTFSKNLFKNEVKISTFVKPSLLTLPGRDFSFLDNYIALRVCYILEITLGKKVWVVGADEYIWSWPGIYLLHWQNKSCFFGTWINPNTFGMQVEMVFSVLKSLLALSPLRFSTFFLAQSSYPPLLSIPFSCIYTVQILHADCYHFCPRGLPQSRLSFFHLSSPIILVGSPGSHFKIFSRSPPVCKKSRYFF